MPNSQNDSKPRFAALHVVIGFGDTLQRIELIHWSNPGPRAEAEGILGVDRSARIPTPDGAATHEHSMGDTVIASAAPTISSVPLTANPPCTALIASPLVAVARMTLAPPSFWSSAAGSWAWLSM